MKLSEDEYQLSLRIGFDPEVSRLIKVVTGCPLMRLLGYTEDFQTQEVDGLSVFVKDGDQAEMVIIKLLPKLIPLGYRAFWSERESNRLAKQYEVAFLKTTSQYEILHIKKTDGANYDISTEDIIAKLKDWERFCQFTVVGAAGDWVALQFQQLPENLCQFAEAIYDLCPDSVEQGVGLRREARYPELYKAARELCPDLPEAKMGINLLANELYTSKYVFLWWD
ncbi:MAG: DUF4253 domain-containing protein [Acidobacteriota bacterium]